MSIDEIEGAKLRWETKEQFRLANLPPWEQPDALEEQEDSSQAPESEEEDEEEVAVSDEHNAMYIGGDCV